jgi:DNA repair protein RadD
MSTAPWQTDQPRRRRCSGSFAGETLILSNAELFGEGFDVPAIEAAISAPTDEVAVAAPSTGRTRAASVRRASREAIILDHAGNSLIARPAR